MSAPQNLNLNLDTKYSRYLLSLPENDLRKRLIHTLEQLTHYASLADSEVHQEDPVFGSMLYAHLISVGIAEQTDGSVHLTRRGKDLLFILACYLDAIITE